MYMVSQNYDTTTRVTVRGVNYQSCLRFQEETVTTGEMDQLQYTRVGSGAPDVTGRVSGLDS